MRLTWPYNSQKKTKKWDLVRTSVHFLQMAEPEIQKFLPNLSEIPLKTLIFDEKGLHKSIKRSIFFREEEEGK